MQILFSHGHTKFGKVLKIVPPLTQKLRSEIECVKLGGGYVYASGHGESESGVKSDIGKSIMGEKCANLKKKKRLFSIL